MSDTIATSSEQRCCVRGHEQWDLTLNSALMKLHIFLASPKPIESSDCPNHNSGFWSGEIRLLEGPCYKYQTAYQDFYRKLHSNRQQALKLQSKMQTNILLASWTRRLSCRRLCAYYDSWTVLCCHPGPLYHRSLPTLLSCAVKSALYLEINSCSACLMLQAFQVSAIQACM